MGRFLYLNSAHMFWIPVTKVASSSAPNITALNWCLQLMSQKLTICLHSLNVQLEAVDFCQIKLIMTQRCTQIFLIIVIMDWLTDNDFLWQQEYFKWHPSWLWCISWHNINHWMSLMTRVSQLLDNTCTAALQHCSHWLAPQCSICFCWHLQ